MLDSVMSEENVTKLQKQSAKYLFQDKVSTVSTILKKESFSFKEKRKYKIV